MKFSKAVTSLLLALLLVICSTFSACGAEKHESVIPKKITLYSGKVVEPTYDPKTKTLNMNSTDDSFPLSDLWALSQLDTKTRNLALLGFCQDWDWIGFTAACSNSAVSGKLSKVRYFWTMDDDVENYREAVFENKQNGLPTHVNGYNNFQGQEVTLQYNSDGNIKSSDYLGSGPGGDIYGKFSYDSRGNLVSMDGMKISYDDAGRMISCGKSKFVYDSDGNLIHMEIDLYDDGDVKTYDLTYSKGNVDTVKDKNGTIAFEYKVI